jgi:hypothetical protein
VPYNISDISSKGRLLILNDAACTIKITYDYHIVARSEIERNDEQFNRERRDNRNDKHQRIVQ